MLTINPSELILTIFNFFLLFFLLKKFLYKPLISFMDERKKGIEEKMEMEKNALKALEQLEADLQLQRRNALADARNIVAQAKTDMEQRSRELLRRSKELTGLNRKKAAVSAAMISEREKQKVCSNLDRLAQVLARNLLGA